MRFYNMIEKEKEIVNTYAKVIVIRKETCNILRKC